MSESVQTTSLLRLPEVKFKSVCFLYCLLSVLVLSKETMAKEYAITVLQGNDRVKLYAIEPGAAPEKSNIITYAIESSDSADTFDDRTNIRFEDSSKKMFELGMQGLVKNIHDDEFKISSMVVGIAGKNSYGDNDHSNVEGTKNEVFQRFLEETYNLKADQILLKEDTDIVLLSPFFAGKTVDQKDRNGLVIYATTFVYSIMVLRGKSAGLLLDTGNNGGRYQIGQRFYDQCFLEENAEYRNKKVPYPEGHEFSHALPAIISLYQHMNDYNKVRRENYKFSIFQAPHKNVLGRYIQTVAEGRIPVGVSTSIMDTWDSARAYARNEEAGAIDYLLEYINKAMVKGMTGKLPVYVFADDYFSERIHDLNLQSYIANKPELKNITVLEGSSASLAVVLVGRELMQQQRAEQVQKNQETTNSE